MSRYSKSDYINREMAADSIVIECDGVTLEQARQALKDCPSADVVKVVRCKECKWWTKQEDSLQGRCALMQSYPTGTWYCANGERENDECK